MKKLVISIIFLWVFGMYSVFADTTNPVNLALYSNYHGSPPTVTLNHNDLSWLTIKQTLTVGVYRDEIPPLMLSDVRGYYWGMNADYLMLLKKCLHIDLAINQYQDQQQALAALRAGNVDLVLTSPAEAENIKRPYITTLPLIRGYPTLITRLGEVTKPLYDQSEVTVAINQEFPPENFIKSIFPNAKIVSYPDSYQALSSVSNNESDYFIGNNVISSFIIARDFYQTLGMVRFWREPAIDSHFVAMDSQRSLVRVINNFINSIDEPIHQQIMHSWIDTGDLSFLDKPLAFTHSEERWLAKHQVLRALVNPYYAPFSMIDDNLEIRGLTGDILNLVQLQTGLTFQPVIVNSNSDIVDIMRKGKWDIIPAATYSPDREEEMSFTHSFMSTPFVLVRRVTTAQSDVLKPGSKVAIASYHSLSEKLHDRYPDVKWIIAENSSTALSMVNIGSVDAAVSTQLASRFIIDHYYPQQLTYLRLPEEKMAQISFAIPRGSPGLKSILNKALDNIPPKEMLNLAGKWVKTPDIKIKTWDLYSRPFYLVIGFSVLFVVSSLLWGTYLLRAIRRRKSSQAALEYQLNYRQTLSNSVPVPVYVISLEGDLESFNKMFSNFFSPELRQALQYSLYDRRSPLAEIFPTIQSEIEQGIKPDTVVTHQLVLNNGVDERTILHWLTFCRMPASMPSTIICGWQDITESRHLMEELQIEKDKAIKASQAKSSFLARMSHEIRTPVSAIIGFLELLTTHNQSQKEVEESVRLAYSTTQSLLGLIGDVLDMEKIETGNFELAPEWVDLESLINSTVANFEALVSQKNLQMTFNSFLPHGQTLWIDHQAIKQVLTNLLSNAIKFTASGGVEVTACTRTKGENRVQLTLSVIDTGPGLSIEEQNQLFKPFSQTRSGKHQTGSGLGLTICREMIERMEGQIQMESRPGVGTTMRVSLITLISDAPPSFPVLPENITLQTGSLKILIVDDNPTTRLLLRRQLNTLGYYNDEAADGLEALSLIKQKDYDLLITDLNMPNMDGIVLTQRVRELNHQIIIWGLTANAQNDQKDRCMAAGMNMCLFKPVGLPRLKALLSEESGRLNLPSLNDFIDMAALKTLSLGDKDLMCRMLGQSKLENDKDIKAARQALERQEWIILRHHLHRINGTAQLLNARDIHLLAGKLENMLAAEHYGTLMREGISELEQLVHTLSDAIDIFCN